MARTFGGGSTDSVWTALQSNSTQRSYSIWVLRTGDGGGSLGRIFDKRTAAAQSLVLYNNGAGGAVSGQPNYAFSTAFTGTSEWSWTRPAVGDWHHVVVAWDSSVGPTSGPSVWMDGIAQTLTQEGTGTGTFVTNSDSYIIGNRTNDNARNWAGDICEFVVWNTLLVAQDALDLFRGVSPLKIKSGSLAGYWPIRFRESPEPDYTGNTTAAPVTGTVYAAKDPPPFSPPFYPPVYQARQHPKAIVRR